MQIHMLMEGMWVTKTPESPPKLHFK